MITLPEPPILSASYTGKFSDLAKTAWAKIKFPYNPINKYDFP